MFQGVFLQKEACFFVRHGILQTVYEAKKLSSSTAFLFLSIFLFFFISLCIILSVREWQRNTVSHVIDGDTFTLHDGRRVRLLGVDAPEEGRCMADRATERLTILVHGKHVRLKDQTMDSYGRIMANVIADEPFGVWMKYLYHRFFKRDEYKGFAMINRVMVEEGLGKYSFSGTQYSKVLTSAHELARTRQLGIYSSVCRQLEARVPNCVVKGNIRNGSKTYHIPRCFNYDDTIIDTSFGDQWFCVEEEAIAAGFTKATGCPVK